MNVPPISRFWRKKPVTIEAVQYDGTNGQHVIDALGMRLSWDVRFTPTGGLLITTLESAEFLVRPDDWVIKGVKGEFYACKPDIFALTYEAVAAASENRSYIPPPADANGKRPRLFYWEDAEDCWCPAEGLEVDNIISVDLFLGDGETMAIRFKREDMTDAEFAAIPEG